MTKAKRERFRARLARVVEIGAAEDTLSRGYDLGITLVIVINLVAAILSTFQGVYSTHGVLLDAIEGATAALFALDYILCLIAAKYIYLRDGEARSVWAYVTSFTGIVNLLSFLPYYLPVFFPEGAVAFRIFRIIRIFRLFRINTYYDSLNAITEVLVRKKQQLLSSGFIILVLMIASSLCMYSVEHEAQPEVFQNAFSGIWWSVSTLLTVGYGDIYPVTTLGKLLSIIITFLGVGMVAIPTGIISAGFVEQYTHMQNSAKLASEAEVDFFKVRLQPHDPWVGKRGKELDLPAGMILAAVHRGREVLLPREDLILTERDIVLLAGDPIAAYRPVELKEMTLTAQNPWTGQYIRDLDLSRRTVIVMVKRNGRVILPDGGTRLKEGDVVWLHTRLLSADSAGYITENQ